MTKIKYLVPVVLLLSGLILTACGEATYINNQPLPKPYGSYFTNINMYDLRSEPAGFSKYLGRWELQLGKNNLFSFKLDGSEVDEGVYEWTDAQLIFYSGRMVMNCSSLEEGEPSGIYRWTFDGKHLTFSKDLERCYGRGVLLRAHAFSVAA